MESATKASPHEIEENTEDKVAIHFEEDPASEDCPVCLEEMTSDRITLKPCQHQFCQSCIKTITERLGICEKLICPLCRQNVDADFNLLSLLTRLGNWKANAFHCSIFWLCCSACCIISITGVLIYIFLYGP